MRYGIILLILMVSGCGQKGALFMPSETPKQAESAVNSPAAAPVSINDSKKS